MKTCVGAEKTWVKFWVNEGSIYSSKKKKKMFKKCFSYDEILVLAMAINLIWCCVKYFDRKYLVFQNDKQ